MVAFPLPVGILSDNLVHLIYKYLAHFPWTLSDVSLHVPMDSICCYSTCKSLYQIVLVNKVEKLFMMYV